jgi:hypothetical protein
MQQSHWQHHRQHLFTAAAAAAAAACLTGIILSVAATSCERSG